MCHVNSWWRWSDLLVASHSDLLSVPCTHGNTDKCCKTGPNTWNCFRFVFFLNWAVGVDVVAHLLMERLVLQSHAIYTHLGEILKPKLLLMHPCVWMCEWDMWHKALECSSRVEKVEKSAIKTGPFNIYHLSTLTRGVLTSARSQCSLAWQYSSALSEAWRPSSLGNGWKQNKLLKR